MIASLGEHALIERVRARAGAPPAWVTLGIGDDAAIFAADRGHQNVVTTDSLVEGVHFRRDWTSARAIGRKALATNLSDLAAMGAMPRAALLSLAMPDGLLVDDFDALVDGFVTLGTATGTPLVGGNLTRSPGPLVVTTTAIGGVRIRKALTRGGAFAGDELYVTGTIGAAAAGLAMLAAGVDRSIAPSGEAECIRRYEEPEPRIRHGLLAARTRSARACVDLSDGLADGARQLAAACGTGVVVDAERIPIHNGARSWAARTSQDPVSLALSGGEDYELLFAVAPRRRRSFLAAMKRCHAIPVTAVGRLTSEPGAWLRCDGELCPLPKGHDHFPSRG